MTVHFTYFFFLQTLPLLSFTLILCFVLLFCLGVCQHFSCKVFKVSHLYCVPCLPQSIPPLEFTLKNDRISLAFVEATIYNPMVAKGSICRDMKVFPAECRGRRCSYRGRLVVSLTPVQTVKC